jgi:ABC-type nitrate/sulfonate/bicarbonate transport system substrate-binding protein
MRRRPRTAAVLALVAALAVAGCSRAEEDRPNARATIALDAPLAAVDAGLELMLVRDFDDAEGMELGLQAPTARRTALERLVAGRAQFAVLDIHDLARAREHGRDVVGVMAIVQQPRMRIIGAPPYPPLLLCTGRITLQDDPNLVRATLSAIARGYQEVIGDPETGVMNLLAATKGLQQARVARELDDISPDFTAGARVFGQLDPERLQAWATWAKQTGKVRRAPDVQRMFDGRYVPRSGSRD